MAEYAQLGIFRISTQPLKCFSVDLIRIWGNHGRLQASPSHPLRLRWQRRVARAFDGSTRQTIFSNGGLNQDRHYARMLRKRCKIVLANILLDELGQAAGFEAHPTAQQWCSELLFKLKLKSL
jgi:hypothetical protein